jgi:hypothetical protein
MNEEKNQTRPSPQYPMAQRIELWNVDRLETGTAMTQVAVERGVTPKADAEGPKRKSK